MSEAAIAQVVEERIAQFAHKAPALIRDSESDVLGVRADDSGVASSGMAYKGKIYLFRDGLADSSEVVRTVWHGLLHYGLRRFLNSGQYIAAMLHRCWGELQCARKSSTVAVTKERDTSQIPVRVPRKLYQTQTEVPRTPLWRKSSRLKNGRYSENFFLALARC